MRQMSYGGVAALTIVSKNYIALARVLCASFLEYHPGARFFVVLVDQNDGDLDPTQEQFTLLDLQDIGLPRPDVFPYQYNVLELNTAVKPFALKTILDQTDIQKIAYIDPDICIYRPLDKVWDGLDTNSVVITPHMREPFPDDRHPSELSIIQSGTYNLGFIALGNDKTAETLLDWWAERLYLHCRVDIPSGLFTDQKWIDLVPGYFEGVMILRDPAYNIAYWNLHERSVSVQDSDYMVDGQPLVFFHFSGFDPDKPKILSKHQNRHRLKDYPDLELLFSVYRKRLISAGLNQTRELEYAFEYLPNGIKVSEPVHAIVRRCLEQGIRFPSPAEEPDDFCRFLMTPNIRVTGNDVAPIVAGILEIRTDVGATFPGASKNKGDPGFRQWLRNSGQYELGLDGLVDEYETLLEKENSVSALANIYYSRPDLGVEYPDVFSDQQDLTAFKQWARAFASKEYRRFSSGDVERFCCASGGVKKVLNLIYGRPDLQKAFINIGTPQTGHALADWLFASLDQMTNISEDEVQFFVAWEKANRALLARVNLAYNCWIRDYLGTLPNLFLANRLFEFLDNTGYPLSGEQIQRWLVDEYLVRPLDHLAAYYRSSASLCRRFPRAFESANECLALVEWVVEKTDIADYVDDEWIDSLRKDTSKLEEYRSVINVAGFMNATTGMGESARSMVATLEAGGQKVESYTLPSVFTVEDDIQLDQSGKIFGSTDLLAGTTIVVANADTVELVNRLYPIDILEGKKVGYWVWETETLPNRWRKMADYYDEIWSPSTYSARAIEETTGADVKVVPHSVSVSQPATIEADRERFNLPQDAFIFGYFFDQKSFLERKNPKGLIDAFHRAFGEREDVYLLMKVGIGAPGQFEYERLKASTAGRQVLWVERDLPREELLVLMKSLDAYVSLHRSEGFGLTMAEALTLGIPTIGSEYSGNLQFMNQQNSYLVRTSRRKIGRDIGPYRRECHWGDPDIGHAAQQMLHAQKSSAGETATRGFDDLDPRNVFDEFVEPLLTGGVLYPNHAAVASSR